MIKLIRECALIALNLAWHLTGLKRFQFLWGYISGQGRHVDVSSAFDQDIKAQLVAMMYAQAEVAGKSTITGYITGELRWWHTLNYEGSGFWGRPELFYMIGCFTSNFVVKADDRKIRFFGTDRYDWHPAANGEYHCSTLPNKWYIVCLFAALEYLGMGEWFTTDSWPMGGPGVSNKLWADMLPLGAKEFDSHWDFEVDLPEDLWAILEAQIEPEPWEWFEDEAEAMGW